MKKLALFGAPFLLPLVALAQDTNLGTIRALTQSVGDIVNLLIPIAFALAVLFFFWGLATYILGAEDNKEVAKKRMIWGVVAIFVMASIWGLVNFIAGTFGVDNGDQPGVDITLPTVN